MLVSKFSIPVARFFKDSGIIGFDSTSAPETNAFIYSTKSRVRFSTGRYVQLSGNFLGLSNRGAETFLTVLPDNALAAERMKCMLIGNGIQVLPNKTLGIDDNQCWHSINNPAMYRRPVNSSRIRTSSSIFSHWQC